MEGAFFGNWYFGGARKFHDELPRRLIHMFTIYIGEGVTGVYDSWDGAG